MSDRCGFVCCLLTILLPVSLAVRVYLCVSISADLGTKVHHGACVWQLVVLMVLMMNGALFLGRGKKKESVGRQKSKQSLKEHVYLGGLLGQS